MSSAASRVFALPELLEPILFDLPWQNLFSLLRINTTFRNTILNSQKLRRCMHLEHQLPTDIQEAPLECMCNFCYLSLGFLRILRADRRIYGALNLSHFVLPINMYSHKNFYTEQEVILIDCISTRSKAAKKSKKGKAARVRFSKELLSAIWREMKLTKLPRPIRVTIEAHRGKSLQHQYSEVVEFAAGEGSVGESFDALNRIRKRTPGEHRNRRKELQREGQES